MNYKVEEKDRKGWTPGSSRNKKLRKRRYRERQARKLVMSLTAREWDALKKAIKEREEMPAGLTLEIWEDIKSPGMMDQLGAILEKKLGMSE